MLSTAVSCSVWGVRHCLNDTYGQVNISEECREKVLATDVTAYDIFDDARAEVLAVMEVSVTPPCLGQCNSAYSTCSAL